MTKIHRKQIIKSIILSLFICILVGYPAYAAVEPASSSYYLGYGCPEGMTYEKAIDDAEKTGFDRPVIEKMITVLKEDPDYASILLGKILSGNISPDNVRYMLDNGCLLEYTEIFDKAGIIKAEEYPKFEQKSLNSVSSPAVPSHIEGHIYDELDDTAQSGLIRQTLKKDSTPDVYINIPDTAENKTVNGATLNRSLVNARDIFINFTKGDTDTLFYGWRFSNWMSTMGYELPLGISYGEDHINFDANCIIPCTVQVWLKMNDADTNYNIYSQSGLECSVMSDDNGYISFKTDTLTSYKLTKGNIEAVETTEKIEDDLNTDHTKNIPGAVNIIYILAGILFITASVIIAIMTYRDNNRYY